MNYINELRSIAQTAHRKISFMKLQQNDLQAKCRQGRIGQKDFEERMQQLELNIAMEQSEGRAEVTRLQAAYNEAAETWNAPSGEKVHDDARLFTTGVPLSSDDLAVLAKKHRQNTTMTRILRDYAQQHGVHVNVDMPTVESKKLAFNECVEATKSAIKDPLYYEQIFDNTDNFNKVFSGYDISLETD